jgi:hypothetical protein
LVIIVSAISVVLGFANGQDTHHPLNLQCPHPQAAPGRGGRIQRHQGNRSPYADRQIRGSGLRASVRHLHQRPWRMVSIEVANRPH